MPERNPMDEEHSTEAADAPTRLPPWDRDALALKIQSIDGCTAGDASREIDEMAKSLQLWARQPPSNLPRNVEPSPSALVYVRRTDCSGRPRWQPQTSLLLMAAAEGVKAESDQARVAR